MSAELDHDLSQNPAAVALSDTQAQSFWAEFSRQLGTLQALEGERFVEAANALLQPYAPGLALELEGTLEAGDATLVITAHGNTAEFENALVLVRQAPQRAGLAVQAFRSRTSNADLGLRMEGLELTSSDVQVGYYDAGGIVGLELAFTQAVPSEMESSAQHMAFIMLDHILGEWDFSVRVGPVDFVDRISPDLAGPVTLAQLPPEFDRFSREALGRSYELPPEQESRWLSLQVRGRDAADDEDTPPDLLSFHDSANAVATRADLSYLMEWRLGFDSQEELDQARDLQDALDTELAQQQRGILVFTRVERMCVRQAAYYVDDPAHAQQRAEQLVQRYAPGMKAELQLSFDPAWNEYLSLYSAIHRQQAQA